MIKNIILKQIKKTGYVRALEMENKKLKTQNIKIKEVNLKVVNDKLRLLEEVNLKVVNDKLRLLEEEKEKFCTIPNFDGLNKTLKGKDGFLFLVNDGNNEIRQHFDQSYVNDFNSCYFIKYLNFKVEYCRNNDIKYFFFLVPDKSIVCREFLPFDIKIIKRNYDLIKHLVPDFSENLDHSCYWDTDSHINFLGGKKLSYYLLNYIDENFKQEDFDKLVEEQLNIDSQKFYTGDLTSFNNWSYSEDEKLDYISEKAIFIYNKYLKDLKESLPEKFQRVYERDTLYLRNDNGFTNLKILILNDSSTNFLNNVLSIYFKEMIFYWDHWMFNKEIIEWFKPDIIVEIRTERFLEGMEHYNSEMEI